MNYLIASIWGWMLAALVVGLIVGWLTCSRERSSWFSGWTPIALVVFLVALVAALFAWLPGRPGLWLETGLLLFASYIVGCCLGCWFKQLFGGADALAPKAVVGAAGAATAAAAGAALRPVAAPAAAAPAAVAPRPSATPPIPAPPRAVGGA